MKQAIRLYNAVVTALAILSGTVLVMMTIAIGAEAIMRTLGLGMIRGVIDLSEYALFGIALLAAPWLMRSDGHIRVTVLVTQLPARWQSAMLYLADLICLMVCLIVFWYSMQVLMRSWRSGQRIFQDIVVPDWWLQWQMPLVTFLLAIAFVERLLRPAPVPAKPSDEGF